MPACSIIIPLFDSRRTIAEALESVRAQTVSDWEAIIVNDGSTDDGPVVARAVAARDPRFRVVDQSNQGLAAARNTGIAHASAPYLLFLDSDDWLEPNALADLLPAATSSPSGAAYAAAEWRDDEGRSLGWSSDVDAGPIGLHELLDYNRFPVHAQLIRRDVLGDLRFRRGYYGCEDYDLWTRLALRGVAWSPVDRLVCGYRMRPGSMSRSFDRMARSIAAVIEQTFVAARELQAKAGDIPCSPCDCSMLRRTSVLERNALDFATRACLDGEDGCEQAVAIYADRSPVRHIASAAAAEAAYWSIPYAECRAPTTWLEHADRYAEALVSFWSRCIEKGWAAHDLPGRVIPHLASWLVRPQTIAAHLADAAAESRLPVVLIGFGANGRRLARALMARNIPCSARDDRALEPAETVLGTATIKVFSNRAPFDPDALHIVTPGDDRAIMRSLPPQLRRLRWSQVRDTLSAAALAQLHPAFARAQQRVTSMPRCLDASMP